MSPLFQFFEYSALSVLSRIAPKTFKRAFEMAQVNRLTGDWNSFANTLNSDIRISLPQMQKRSRDLYMNDPYAKKIIRDIGFNAVGHAGFILRNKAMKIEFDENGKQVEVLDTETNKLIQNLWKEFCKKQNATITGDMTERETKKIMIQQVALDGEVFKIHIRGKNVNKFGYTQQYLESDLCDITYNDVSKRGNPIVMGIEYDEYRRPLNYYFKKVSVQMDALGIPYSKDYIEIPASRVDHEFVRESFNQLRGIPWLAPTGLRLKMLKGFEDASLLNARVSAMKTNVLEPVEGKNNPLTAANVASSTTDEDGNLKQNIQPGTTYTVPSGYKYVKHDPAYPSDQHEPFRKSILKGTASGVGMSFIRIANSYEDANYTSTRGSFLDEQNLWKELHTWIIEHDIIPTFEKFLENSLLTGLIDIDIREFSRINAPHFQGRTWQMLNPKDEVKANYDAWLSRQKPLSIILAEQGLDFEETIDQFAYELKYMENKKVDMGKIGSGTAPSEINNDGENNNETKKEKLKRAI